MHKRHFSVPMALLVITGISDTSFADDATPLFEKAPGAIVSGLSGLIKWNLPSAHVRSLQ